MIKINQIHQIIIFFIHLYLKLVREKTLFKVERLNKIIVFFMKTNQYEYSYCIRKIMNYMLSIKNHTTILEQ